LFALILVAKLRVFLQTAKVLVEKLLIKRQISLAHSLVFCTFAAMKKMFLRLWLIVVLLCGLADSLSWISAQDVVRLPSHQDACIEQHNGLVSSWMEERQRPFGQALVKSQSSQRIGSSRSSRVLPTYGGKPGRSMGHGASSYSSNCFNGVFLCRNTRIQSARAGVSLPRFYYVIALRRLLC